MSRDLAQSPRNDGTYSPRTSVPVQCVQKAHIELVIKQHRTISLCFVTTSPGFPACERGRLHIPCTHFCGSDADIGTETHRRCLSPIALGCMKGESRQKPRSTGILTVLNPLQNRSSCFASSSGSYGANVGIRYNEKPVNGGRMVEGERMNKPMVNDRLPMPE